MADFFNFSIGKCIVSENGIWYRNIQFLGKGGNSNTYLVLCTSGAFRGILFALRVFRIISKEERKAKFLEERRFLGTDCNHPSIMRVFDIGRYSINNEKYPFMITEYLPYTLRQKIQSRSTSIVEKIAYIIQLLSALEYLDKLPTSVVHRDIKPENIFLKGQSCVLGDFGLMKVLNNDKGEERNVYKLSGGYGMPYFYRTPDLISYAKNESEITTKSDVFQLGLVAAELFTGKNPEKPPTNNEFLSPLIMEELRRINGSLGKRLKQLINKMLVISPEERETAEQLIDQWRTFFEEAIRLSHQLEGKAL